MTEWAIHEGIGHIRKSWAGFDLITWCGQRIPARTFREPKRSRGERDCLDCLDQVVAARRG